MIRAAVFGTLIKPLRFRTVLKESGLGDVVYVWSPDSAGAGKTAAEIGCRCSDDYNEILADKDVDGVIIVTSNSYHKELIIAAAKAGKAVFCEKPMAINYKDACEIAEVIRETGVTFFMSDPQVRRGAMKLKELIESGVLGDITSARLRLASNRGFDKTHVDEHYDKNLSLGGIMADVGFHMLHTAYYLFGMPAKVSSVFTSHTEAAKANGIEEVAVTTLTYENGPVVTMEASWVNSGDDHGVEIYGSRGCAEIIGSPRNETVKMRINKGEEKLFTEEELPENPDLHAAYWARMILEKVPNELIGTDPKGNCGTGIDAAVKLARIDDAIYESAAAGRAVMI